MAGLLAIARKLFGVSPNAAWIRSSSSFASPVAVAGSIGVKRGITAPFVGDATRRRRLEWSCPTLRLTEGPTHVQEGRLFVYSGRGRVGLSRTTSLERWTRSPT